MSENDCPVCAEDFDLRIQHEMHRGFPQQGLKGGERIDEDILDAEDENFEVFEKEW